MDDNSQLDALEQILAEILADPEIRAVMLELQPIDVEMN